MSGSTEDRGLFHRITGVSFQEVNKKIGDSLRPLPNMKPVCERLAIELRTKEEIKRLAAESNIELKKQQDILVDMSWKHGLNNTVFVVQTAIHGAAGAAASLTYIDDFDPTDSDYDTTKGYQTRRAELQQMTEVAHEKIAAAARRNESLQDMADKTNANIRCMQLMLLNQPKLSNLSKPGSFSSTDWKRLEQSMKR